MFVLADLTQQSPAFFKKESSVGACVTFSLNEARLFKTRNEARQALGELKDDFFQFKLCALAIKPEPWMPNHMQC